MNWLWAYLIAGEVVVLVALHVRPVPVTNVGRSYIAAMLCVALWLPIIALALLGVKPGR